MKTVRQTLILSLVNHYSRHLKVLALNRKPASVDTTVPEIQGF